MASHPPRASSLAAVVLCAWLAVAGAATAVATPIARAPVQANGGTSTTDVAVTTTTTGAPVTTTIPASSASTSPAVSPTDSPTTTTTVPVPTTSTTLDPLQVSALLQGLDGDIARAQAVSDFLAARALASQLGNGQAVPANADPVFVSVAAAQLRAATAQAEARQRFATARYRIGRVAVALYLGEQVPRTGTAFDETPGRSVFLSGILDSQQRQAKRASQALAQATAAFDASRKQADHLVQARTVELQAQALQAAAAANAGRPAVNPAAASGTPSQSLVTQQSPTILGPSVLTADELVGWYRTSGHQPRLTAPLETVAAAFVSVGAADGVRADIAFAQSMIETGYFAFPSFGQVAIADNNYAGIGACDSCSNGIHFHDALAGVQAQMQLLHAYATKLQPVPGPLPGPFVVAGCCQTWMALTGVWATATDYGVKILKLYRAMVQWALARRSAAARL